MLLLISADFLASVYCYAIEMQRAMERYEAGEARVIPIILKPIDNWFKAPFRKLQTFSKDAKPVTKWSNREDAFVDIARGIRGAQKPSPPPSQASPPHNRGTPVSPAGTPSPPAPMNWLKQPSPQKPPKSRSTPMEITPDGNITIPPAIQEKLGLFPTGKAFQQYR